jgi:hypothetical protein
MRGAAQEFNRWRVYLGVCLGYWTCTPLPRPEICMTIVRVPVIYKYAVRAFGWCSLKEYTAFEIDIHQHPDDAVP